MDDVISPGALLPQVATQFGDKLALVTSTRTLTFRELDAESDCVAAGLIARGVRPGGTVSLYAPAWRRTADCSGTRPATTWTQLHMAQRGRGHGSTS
ncbi:AMP-binding protein [Streptomyces sp. NPDC002838]|uniref:AMP-binding protein n=1 Tax=Streptomyces sp. NPDC002838 TaxID=3154436 RepID=UPI00333428FA